MGDQRLFDGVGSSLEAHHKLDFTGIELVIWGSFLSEKECHIKQSEARSLSCISSMGNGLVQRDRHYSDLSEQSCHNKNESCQSQVNGGTLFWGNWGQRRVDQSQARICILARNRRKWEVAHSDETLRPASSHASASASASSCAGCHSRWMKKMLAGQRTRLLLFVLVFFLLCTPGCSGPHCVDQPLMLLLCHFPE